MLLAAAAVVAFAQAGRAREEAIAGAVRRARVAAQTKLAPALVEADLEGPITGGRYDHVAATIRRTILGRTHVKQVTIWSDVGRVLFSQDEGTVGTRPTYVRDLVYAVANGTTQTTIESGTLKTFTPIWRQPGGTVVVAELDQPLGPVAGTTGRMLTLAGVVFGLGSLVCWVLFATAWRPGAATAAARSPALQGRPLRRPATGAQALGPVMAAGTAAPPAAAPPAAAAPMPNSRSEQPGLREAERARGEAEKRAAAAEERLKKLQLQHKQAMERLEALEARLSVAAAAPKHTQEELRVLRDQVRESAERLHTAERENERLRARLGTPHLPGVVAGGNAR